VFSMQSGLLFVCAGTHGSLPVLILTVYLLTAPKQLSRPYKYDRWDGVSWRRLGRRRRLSITDRQHWPMIQILVFK